MKELIAVGKMVIIEEEGNQDIGGFVVANTGKFKRGIVKSIDVCDSKIFEEDEIVYIAEKAYPVGLGLANTFVINVEDIVGVFEKEYNDDEDDNN